MVHDGTNVPALYGIVETSANETTAIRSKRDAKDRIRVAVEASDELSVREVPYSKNIAHAACRYMSTVGRDGG